MGRMTPDEAAESATRHYVTNATGSDTFRLHVSELQSLTAGDALLVCSDGLHGVVRLGKMEELLVAGHSAEGRCRRLVLAAAERGGYDDISVVVINVES